MSAQDREPRTKVHLNGFSLGLNREELSHAPAADVDPIARVEGEIVSFIPREPVSHPEEVSLDAIKEGNGLNHERPYPTFGAPTHRDQEM